MWTDGGQAALVRHAPCAARAYADLLSARPADVDSSILADPAVSDLLDQFRTDVAGITAAQRAAFVAATGRQLFPVIQVVWLTDVAPRLRSALDALFGDSDWAEAAPRDVPDTWPFVEGFMQAVARLDALDPVLTELVRLRGARQHDCRVCRSRRSVAAIDSGADESTFAAVDDYSTSALPPQSRAALALVDAIIWTPNDLPPDVLDGVRAQLSPAEAVEVVLDVIRNAANKIAVALRADAPEVTEGVQLFTTAADGTLTTLL